MLSSKNAWANRAQGYPTTTIFFFLCKKANERTFLVAYSNDKNKHQKICFEIKQIIETFKISPFCV